jgi:arabinogalactan oligomer/maltooligosaccharide transport system permease protein
MAQSKMAYLYIAPAAIVMALITVTPILFQTYMAFTDYAVKHLNPKFSPQFIGLDNFVQIATNQTAIENFNFWRILTFDLVWTFSNIAIHVTTGIVLALILNYKGLIAKKIYRALYMIPWVMPGLIVAVVWRNMFDTEFGAINQFLSALIKPLYDVGLMPGIRQALLNVPFLTGFANGIPATQEMLKIRWLLQPDPIVDLGGLLVLPLSFFAVLIVNCWLGWPFMMTVATGALQSIPLELYEAARVDGASRWQQFWSITAPLLRPAMIPAVMLSIIWTFNQFNVIYFVSQGGPFGLTEILVTQAFKLVNPRGAYGLASAFNIIVFLVLLIITLTTNRVSRATEAYNV